MNKYYEAHISYNHTEGYSVFFESDKQLNDDEDILEEACALDILHEWDDAEYMDYAIEITEGEYREAKGLGD